MDYLFSKLTIPQCDSKIVEREKILECLKSAKEGGAIYLSAPAGYGKTVAVSCWTQTTKIPCAWYSLESIDNNPLQFIRYFAKSINLVYPEFKAEQFETINDIRTGFDSLFMCLQRFQKKFIVVLDDFQCIDHTNIIAFINRLILSRLFSVIITSRYEIPEGLEESLLRQKLKYIGKNILLFNENDIRVFLNKKNIFYNESNISNLLVQSEGWALAVVSLSYDIEYAANATALKGHKYIKGFLNRQVWNNLNEQERKLIKYTAVLNEFTAEAAETLTGYKNAKAIISSLMKKCLFLSFIKADGEWYRYHHLIGEFITENLSSSSEVIKIYNAVAKYFYEKIDIIKAVEYYSRADNKKEILNIIINNPRKILMLFEPKEIVILIDSLKEQSAFEYINVLVCYGWAMQQVRRPYEAQAFISNISDYLECSKDKISDELQSKIQLEISAMKLPFNVANKDIEGTIESLKIMSIKINDPIVYSFEAVQSLYGSEYTLRDTISGFYGRHLFMMNIMEMIKQPKHKKIYEFVAYETSIVISFAETLCELNRHNEASDLIIKYMDRAMGNTKLYMPAMICFANIQKYKGDFKGAYNSIEKCRQYLVENSDYMAVDTLLAYKINMDCLLHDYKSIREWKDKCLITPYDDVSDISRHTLYQYLTYVNVLIILKQNDLAKMLTGKLLTMLEKLPDLVYKSQALYFDALLAYLDKDADAEDKFGKMIMLGFGDGYYTTFTDFGEDFYNLVKEFEGSVLPKYQKYISELNVISAHYCMRIKEYSDAQIDSTDVTAKEIKILELLSDNYSNQEIADNLFVSLQTIKNKTSIIYKKLGVKKRGEAVRKAQQIGIL